MTLILLNKLCVACVQCQSLEAPITKVHLLVENWSPGHEVKITSTFPIIFPEVPKYFYFLFLKATSK